MTGGSGIGCVLKFQTLSLVVKIACRTRINSRFRSRFWSISRLHGVKLFGDRLRYIFP